VDESSKQQQVQPKPMGTPWRNFESIDIEENYWLPDYWWDWAKGGYKTHTGNDTKSVRNSLKFILFLIFSFYRMN
jgi:hypothetical protein